MKDEQGYQDTPQDRLRQVTLGYVGVDLGDLVSRGWLEWEGDRISITLEGWRELNRDLTDE